MNLEEEIARTLRDFLQPEGFEVAESDRIFAQRLSPLLNRVRAEAHDVGYRQAVRDCTGDEHTGPIPSHYRDSALAEALRGLGTLSNRELMRQTQEGIRVPRIEQGER